MKKKSFLAYPYIIWSAIFIVIPLILVVLFSFTQKIDGKQVFSIANYRDLMDPIYFKVFLTSIFPTQTHFSVVRWRTLIVG